MLTATQSALHSARSSGAQRVFRSEDCLVSQMAGLSVSAMAPLMAHMFQSGTGSDHGWACQSESMTENRKEHSKETHWAQGSVRTSECHSVKDQISY